MFEDSCLIVELEGMLMFTRVSGSQFWSALCYFLYSCTLQFSCHSYNVEKLVSGVMKLLCCFTEGRLREVFTQHAHGVLSPFRMFTWDIDIWEI